MKMIPFNPKSETRRPKSERNPKLEGRINCLVRAMGLILPAWDEAYFGFRISGIRISDFVKCSLMLAVGLAGSAIASAQSNSVPGPQDYAAFSHFITDRNIFDPNRQPHFYDPTHRFVPRSRPNWTPGIQFVGTMSYAKGWFAFFSGNSADLSKVEQAGNQIAGYTITEITANSVVLESADKKEQSQLKIGDGLREENGKWIFSKAGDLAVADNAPQTTTADAPGTDSSSSTPPPSANEQNDVLKRLMQLREKENQ